MTGGLKAFARELLPAHREMAIQLRNPALASVIPRVIVHRGEGRLPHPGSRSTLRLRLQRHLDSLDRLAEGIGQPNGAQPIARFVHHFEHQRVEPGS